MKLAQWLLVLAVLALGFVVGNQYTRALSTEVSVASLDGLPYPTQLRVSRSAVSLKPPNEADLWSYDYPQFVGLVAEAVAGIDGSAVELQLLPFEYWGELAEGAHRVSATYDPPVAFSRLSDPICDIVLYAPSSADAVGLYVRSTSGSWYQYSTSLPAKRLAAYLSTVIERHDSEGDDG